jgi:DNA sulfur modification protein DndD
VRKAASDVNKAAKGLGSDDKLTQIAARLEQIDKDYSGIEERIEDAKTQFEAFDEKLNDIQKNIDAALVKGDREKLKRDIEQAEAQLKQIENQKAAAAKEHAELFRSLSLGRDLLAPVLDKGLGLLDQLRNRGGFPKTAIPVLKERLQSTICICGESLDPDDAYGKRRRDHIQCLIDGSQKADELQSTITDLYFGSRSLQLDQVADEERWLAQYAKVVERRVASL